MASRTDILTAVRSRKLQPAELPALAGPWIAYPDRRRQFADTLQAVGGRCVEVADERQLHDELARLDPVARAKKICSLIPGVLAPTFDLAAVEDPHELEDVDVAVVPGHFAVAENAAVWVTDETLRHRAVLF